MVQLERWTRLKEADGYLISNLGRVFSLGSEKYLRPYVHKSRRGIYLRFNFPGKKFMAHKLVGDYFVKGRSAERNQLNHKDGNTLNPAAINLEWCTQSENVKYSYVLRRSVTNWIPKNKIIAIELPTIKSLRLEKAKKHSR